MPSCRTCADRRSRVACLFLAACMGLFAWVRPTNAQVAETVGQLLKLDSALALEHMRDKLPPAPTQIQPPRTTGTASGSAPPQFEVLAILGLSGAQRADLALNGRIYRLLPVGRAVDKWRVTAIQGACVHLEALDAPKTPDLHQCFADVPFRAPAPQPSPLARSLNAGEPWPLPPAPAPAISAGSIPR